MDESHPQQKLETSAAGTLSAADDAALSSDLPQDDAVSCLLKTGSDDAADAHKKMTWQEHLKHEVIEVGIVVVYLAVAFCILQTFKCATVLAKCSENHFLSAYTTAGIASLLLGKFVFVLEKMPIAKKFEHRPLIVPVLYKSVLFTILVNIALHLEDRLVHGGAHLPDINADPLAFWLCKFAQELAFFITFFIFFSYREVARVLGGGRLAKLFFEPRD